MHMSHQRWGLGYGLVFSLALERIADSQMFFQSQQTSSHLCKPNPNASTMCIDFRSAALKPLTRVSGRAVFAYVQQLQVPSVLCLRAAAIKNLSNTQSHVKGGREPVRKEVHFFLFLNSSLIHGNPVHPVGYREPALYPPQRAQMFMEACPTSQYLICGPGAVSPGPCGLPRDVGSMGSEPLC